jgi:hypothetical protein
VVVATAKVRTHSPVRLDHAADPPLGPALMNFGPDSKRFRPSVPGSGVGGKHFKRHLSNAPILER